MAVEYKADIDRFGRAHSGVRDPHACQYGVFHTTENSDTTPAVNVADWQLNTANGSSYNLLVGTDGTTVRSNSDRFAPWAAGNPGNRKGLHVSAIGYAARDRAHWLRFPAQIESLARIAADWHRRYGLPLVWLSPADIRAGRRGFTSHQNVYQGDGGPAFRSDPGAGFPHDVVLNRARDITNPPQEEITVSEADRIIEFIKGYVGPIGSDVKDNRQQLTGGRDKGEFPGYPQIDDRTIIDALAVVGEKLGIPGFKDPHGGSLKARNEKES